VGAFHRDENADARRRGQIECGRDGWAYGIYGCAGQTLALLMKRSLWICVLTVILVTLFLRVWLFYLDHLVRDLLAVGGRAGAPLPMWTEFCFGYRKWIPIASIPWICVGAHLSRRSRLNGERLAQFAASAGLAAVALGTFVIIGSLLPFPELITIRQIGYGTLGERGRQW
jgi:hypothetical protein